MACFWGSLYCESTSWFHHLSQKIDESAFLLRIVFDLPQDVDVYGVWLSSEIAQVVRKMHGYLYALVKKFSNQFLNRTDSSFFNVWAVFAPFHVPKHEAIMFSPFLVLLVVRLMAYRLHKNFVIGFQEFLLEATVYWLFFGSLSCALQGSMTFPWQTPVILRFVTWNTRLDQGILDENFEFPS